MIPQSFITEAQLRRKMGREKADIDPMAIDTSVDWNCIGGLSHHIKALKEMVLFPLLYPGIQCCLFRRYATLPT
jgi:ATP-dependent 26S proteasome regulatory subunit